MAIALKKSRKKSTTIIDPIVWLPEIVIDASKPTPKSKGWAKKQAKQIAKQTGKRKSRHGGK